MTKAEYNRAYRLAHREELRAYEQKRMKAKVQQDRLRREAQSPEQQADRRARKRAYNQAYYLANREKALAYAQGRKEIQAENNRRRYQNTRPERLAARRAYYLANEDQERAKRRARYAADKEREREQARKYDRANPEKGRVRNNRRRALKMAASVVPFTAQELEARMAYWGNRCWMCGGPASEVDHVKPLSRGGAHILANLRPACKPCNSSKRNTWPIESVA